MRRWIQLKYVRLITVHEKFSVYKSQKLSWLTFSLFGGHLVLSNEKFLDWDGHRGTEDALLFQGLDDLGDAWGDGIIAGLDNAFWLEWSLIRRIDTGESLNKCYS